jgi:hypothetical protein
LADNAEYQGNVVRIRDYFDLHGEERWVEWAGSTLMPNAALEREEKRRLAEEVRRMEERARLERANRDAAAAAAAKKTPTVSAHMAC